MAQPDAAQIIETQRADWNRVAEGWERWDELLHFNLSFLNHRLIGDARIRPRQRVLDLGSGTGYPAIEAAQAVGKDGRVLGLDLAEAMLERARRKAGAHGLSNIEFRTGDVTKLPLEGASIDAVISRFCLMFLPDVPAAVAEIVRVLKPGGYVAAAVWSSPDQNPFLKLPLDVLKTMLDLPAPAPDQPGIFRLAKPGDLASMMSRAGLQAVQDEELTGEAQFESVEQYFASLMDQAAPLQSAFARLTTQQRTDAEREIKRRASQYQRGNGVFMPLTIRIVVGRKPA